MTDIPLVPKGTVVDLGEHFVKHGNVCMLRGRRTPLLVIKTASVDFEAKKWEKHYAIFVMLWVMFMERCSNDRFKSSG